MKTYPKMKETSIPWLGKIPEHWEVKRLKYCAPLTTEKCTESKDDAIALENIESWTGRLIYTESTFESDGISYRKGDVLFGKLRPYLAKVFLAEKEGEAVGDVFVLRPNVNATPGYVAHSLRTTNFIDTINASTYGSKMPRVSWNFMGNLAFPLPPLPEQQAIAAYLDKTTAKIDALIAEQEKLCTLLAEKRKALISHVVTRGLDPKVKLKPSGISWLGDIPEHWGALKIGYLCKLSSGDFISADKIEDSGQYPVYGGNGLRGFTNSHTMEGEWLLIGRQGALCGNVHLVSGKFWATEHALIVYELVPVCKAWFKYVLEDMNLGQYSTSAAQPGLAAEQIRKLKTCVPPLDEQKAIAAYLDKATAKLDALAAKAEEGIALLKERRSALISEVVTGKVRVA